MRLTAEHIIKRGEELFNQFGFYIYCDDDNYSTNTISCDFYSTI